MKKDYYIYFLSNYYNNVLYVGVTNNIVRRTAEHKAKINKGFTHKYNCDKLVYYEVYNSIIDAIAREKQLKNWKREWKNKLINEFNAEWKDLSEEIGVEQEYIEAVKAEYTQARYAEIAGQARNDAERVCDDAGQWKSIVHCGLDPQSPEEKRQGKAIVHCGLDPQSPKERKNEHEKR